MKLTGKRDIEDNLERLDKLTHEETGMASAAEQLKMGHSVEDGEARGIKVKVTRHFRHLSHVNLRWLENPEIKKNTVLEITLAASSVLHPRPNVVIFVFPLAGPPQIISYFSKIQ